MAQSGGAAGEKLSVIQVGIGGMGNTWLRTVLGSQDAEYAGFVEVSEQTAAQQAEKYGLDRATIHRSLPDALDAARAAGRRIDAVINVTPPQFHREISCAALESGIPVLSEKPLADSIDAAKAIVHTSHRTKVLHVVAQNYRYKVPTQTLKRVLDSGEMGAIGAVEVTFFRGPHFGGFREEMPFPLIIDMSIHHFDLMRFLLGDDPLSVFGRSWNPPWSWFRGDASAAALIDFDGGVTVSYDGSWCSHGRETSWNGDWRFECERGVVSLEDDAVTIQRAGEAPEPVTPVTLPFAGQAYLLHEFAAAIRGGPTPATTCQDNIKSLGIVFDTVRSFETGRVVRCEAR